MVVERVNWPLHKRESENSWRRIKLCTDILTDEAYHLDFQTERFAILFEQKAPLGKIIARLLYRLFFLFTASVVWMAHRKLFKAGGNNMMSVKNLLVKDA